MMSGLTVPPVRSGCSSTAQIPYRPWGDEGEAPLHVAARRWNGGDGRDL